MLEPVQVAYLSILMARLPVRQATLESLPQKLKVIKKTSPKDKTKIPPKPPDKQKQQNPKTQAPSAKSSQRSRDKEAPKKTPSTSPSAQSKDPAPKATSINKEKPGATSGLPIVVSDTEVALPVESTCLQKKLLFFFM